MTWIALQLHRQPPFSRGAWWGCELLRRAMSIPPEIIAGGHPPHRPKKLEETDETDDGTIIYIYEDGTEIEFVEGESITYFYAEDCEDSDGAENYSECSPCAPL